ncbi:AtpZ/AtpI family protein [Paenibacillus thalictri]|uniref:AtpZ/AtpI family protein n=1 Tax=Paenibacillus thalictri TaxID=2527873 RepID=A0A4Q9DMD0_9BACL|nr:AtpZ/AtpI family protein [Paenibacillus thalictri]TBL72946.1 AtpZ/AtpI family protein [Paenibacillus thalictri]
MHKPPSGDNPWRAVALVSAIGADLVVCMAAGYWIGDKLSNWYGGQPIWIVSGIMLGFFIGVFSVILILRKYTGGSNG